MNLCKSLKRRIGAFREVVGSDARQQKLLRGVAKELAKRVKD